MQKKTAYPTRLIYTAGPITGLSFDESTNWRKYVFSKLPPHIKALSPLRGASLDAIKNTKDAKIQMSYEEYPLSSQKGIASKCRMDVMTCDLVLANFLGAKAISRGTIMEVAWADAFRKPIILVIERSGNVNDYMIMREVASAITHDLDEAIKIVTTFLTPLP